jgi:hypothetical protein
MVAGGGLAGIFCFTIGNSSDLNAFLKCNKKCKIAGADPLRLNQFTHSIGSTGVVVNRHRSIEKLHLE